MITRFRNTKKGKSNQILICFIAAFVCLCFAGVCSSNVSAARNDDRNYILNKKTRKIHSIDCPSVKQMSEKNKISTSENLTNLIKQDYVVCRKCRAGIIKSGAGDAWDRFFYPGLYAEEEEIIATYEDYLSAINEMSEWYVDHVPTYASRIQDEKLLLYKGNLHNFKEIDLRNRLRTRQHIVVSSDKEAKSISLLDRDTLIMRSCENAAVNYQDNYKRIKFNSRIAYYPCELLSEGSDYSTPGDDCVRYIFAVFNMMDSQFTKKYAHLTRKSYRKTDSRMLTNDHENIAYGFVNLGFYIYDSKEYVIDVGDDIFIEGIIHKIDDGFQLRKGDILAREGHVHLYLGDGMAVDAPNFG